jgi:hypothetical protein
VGDVHEGDADLLLQLLELVLHRLAQLEVEGAEGLVEEEHRRPVDQRARQGDALPLAARELTGSPVADAGQMHEVERLVGPAPRLGRGDPRHAQAEHDVLPHGHVREERVVLEDGVDRPVEGRHAVDGPAAEQDLARGRLLEARDGAQRRRLAATGGAEQGEELALAHRQGDVVDRAHHLAAAVDELLDELTHLDGGGRHVGHESTARPRQAPRVRVRELERSRTITGR